MALRDTLDKVFSIYIRTLYADWLGFATCYTCEARVHWKDGDCGHFIKRAHSAVRFDENNCRFQCINCNRHRDGMVASFEEHLRDELGDEAVDALIRLGRTEKHYTDREYVEKIVYFRGLTNKNVV